MKRLAATFALLVTTGAFVAFAAPKKKPVATERKHGRAKQSAAERRAAADKDAGPGKGPRSVGDAGVATGVKEAKQTDGGSTYKFGELEIEGRLKTPQIVYFLRRVRAEFAAQDLGHRSFRGELDETKKEPSF